MMRSMVVVTLGGMMALGVTLRAEVAAEEVMNCTFKLFNSDSTAACFLLRDEGKPARTILVTAAHVLEQATGEEAILVLREAMEDGTFQRKELPIQIRQGKEVRWTRHEEEDVAALALSPEQGRDLPALPLEVLAKEDDLKREKLTVGSGISILGYPARLESNGAGFPIARHASIASYPLIPVKPHRTFMADCSTFAGDSGGPVFVTRREGERAGQPLVVGIVVAQYRNDEKIKTLHEERLIRHRLSLGKILQAEFIRETISAVK